MRKLLPLLGLAAVLSILPFIPAPVGPTEAHAVDDPAFIDGGALIIATDGGSCVTIDTTRKIAWQAAVRSEGGQDVRYKFNEACTDRSVCSIGTHNQWLNGNTTYDIAVPSNRPCISVATTDAGTTLRVNVQQVFPRTLPENP